MSYITVQRWYSSPIVDTGSTRYLVPGPRN